MLAVLREGGDTKKKKPGNDRSGAAGDEEVKRGALILWSLGSTKNRE